MRNPNISVPKFKTLLDDFQQAIFAIGTEVYNHANQEDVKSGDVVKLSVTEEYNPLLNNTKIPELQVDSDE
jgi:molecular chaperone DnaK